VHRKSSGARLSRTLLGARNGLVQTAVAMKARIRGLLRAHGIKIEAVSEGEFVGRVRELVQSRCKALWPALRPLCKAYTPAQREAEALRKRLAKAAVSDELCNRLM
jgi:transposase